MCSFYVYTIAMAIFIYCILNLCSFLFNRHSKPLPPGPKPWPIIGNLPDLGVMPHQNIADMVKTYGPLMHLRLGFVDVIVAASASVAEQFFKVHDSNFSSRPPNAGAKYLAYNYQDLVFAPYGPRWRMLRKISSVHLFSGKAIDDYKHVRQDEAAMLVRGVVNEGKEGPVKLGKLLNVCTVNALGRVMLGKHVFGDADPNANDFKSMVVEAMVLAGVFNIGDFIPALEWLDLQGVQAKLKKLHKRFDRFLSFILEEKKINNRNESLKQTDMLSTLISLQQNDVDGEIGKLTDVEIKALLLNMFIAGTDTSSSTIEWAIAELIRHPNILVQVQHELDCIVGRDRLVSESDIAQLTYFQAVIKEVFRLHPSTPLSLPRIAAESCVINGYHIPKGATLLTNVWAIARDPNHWVEPLVFRPERFLPGGEKGNVDIRGNDFEVIPFGAGRRICVGMNLGLRMVQLLTATLIHAFDWDLAEGLVPEELSMEEGYGLTLQRAHPLVVHPKPRLSNRLYHA